MATYILKRRSFAQETESDSEAIDLSDVDVNSLPTADRIKALQVAKAQQAPQTIKVAPAKNAPSRPNYRKTMENQRLDAAENISVDRARDNRRTKTINQNINISRNTMITNKSSENAAKLRAVAALQKIKNQNANANGVDDRLIEMQKVTPLKPVSINS